MAGPGTLGSELRPRSWVLGSGLRSMTGYRFGVFYVGLRVTIGPSPQPGWNGLWAQAWALEQVGDGRWWAGSRPLTWGQHAPQACVDTCV